MSKLTPADVRADPEHWISGGGRWLAENTECDHGYTLVDSCPGCAYDQEVEEVKAEREETMAKVETHFEIEGLRSALAVMTADRDRLHRLTLDQKMLYNHVTADRDQIRDALSEASDKIELAAFLLSQDAGSPVAIRALNALKGV